MKKALLVTTVSGFVPQFEMNNVKILQEMGYEVHYASNYNMPSYGTDNQRLDGTGIICHQIDFVRSPYSVGNFQVYRQLKQLMQREQFQLVHCHTPMGAVMARLAAHATKTGSIVYTAHGFHFFKGAPLMNWLCYYPMEKWLSCYTTQQICVNQEDYSRAQRFFAKYVDYIPSVGLDQNKLCPMTEDQILDKRCQLGIPDDKMVLLSAGEFIKRKNHESMIRAIAKLQELPIVYVICGHGNRESCLKDLAEKLGVQDRVLFTGYRSDMFEIYQTADLYVFPSYQEGLPMSLLEAIGSGLPVVCSDIRGNRDLMGTTISDKEKTAWKFCDGGALVKRADDVDAYAEAIRCCLKEPERMKRAGLRNAEAAKNFTLVHVEEKMREIYGRLERENKTLC